MNSTEDLIEILVTAEHGSNYGTIWISPLKLDEPVDKTLFDHQLLNDDDWPVLIGEISARYLEAMSVTPILLSSTLSDPRENHVMLSNLGEAQKLLRSPRFRVGDEGSHVFAGGDARFQEKNLLSKLMKKPDWFEAPQLRQLDFATSINWPDEVHFWWPRESNQPAPDLVAYLDIMDQVLKEKGLCTPGALRRSL